MDQNSRGISDFVTDSTHNSNRKNKAVDKQRNKLDVNLSITENSSMSLQRT
jgi:hypothetical protein